MRIILTLMLSFTAVYAATQPGGSAPKNPMFSPDGAKAAANAVVPRTADPVALQVVDDYLKASGTKTTYKGIETRYERFYVNKHAPTGITKAMFERYLKKPYMIREHWDMDMKIADKKLDVLQIYNSKTGEGWTRMMGFVDRLKGKMIHQLMHDKFLDDFFMHWKQDGYALKYRGDGEVNGDPCHVVDVYHATSKEPIRYFFSKKTQLMSKRIWKANTRNGIVSNELYFLEWRKAKDLKNPDRWIMFPFKHERFEEKNLVMEREFEEIKVNPPLGDALFGRPDGPIFDPDEIRKKNQAEQKPKEEKKAPWMKRKKRVIPENNTGGDAKKPEEGKTPAKTDKPAEATEKASEATEKSAADK